MYPSIQVLPHQWAHQTPLTTQGITHHTHQGHNLPILHTQVARHLLTQAIQLHQHQVVSPIQACHPVYPRGQCLTHLLDRILLVQGDLILFIQWSHLQGSSPVLTRTVQKGVTIGITTEVFTMEDPVTCM